MTVIDAAEERGSRPAPSPHESGEVTLLPLPFLPLLLLYWQLMVPSSDSALRFPCTGHVPILLWLPQIRANWRVHREGGVCCICCHGHGTLLSSWQDALENSGAAGHHRERDALLHASHRQHHALLSKTKMETNKMKRRGRRMQRLLDIDT